MNNKIDESVLITNTKENFQVLCTLMYPHVDPTPHIANDPYIRIDLSTDDALDAMIQA